MCAQIRTTVFCYNLLNHGRIAVSRWINKSQKREMCKVYKCYTCELVESVIGM